MARAWLLLIVVACGDDAIIAVPSDAAVDAYRGACDPLTQEPCAAGDRCTWIYDDDEAPYPMPYPGHTACVAKGTVEIGSACTFTQVGAMFVDDCATGACDSRPGDTLPTTCRALCNPTGGAPACPSNTTCVTRSAFQQAAGYCQPSCDPLADNDFDGAAGPQIRTGTACQSHEGCYGSPSQGTAPVTGFACSFGPDHDLLRHRGVSTSTFVNSCSPGYQPLLRESTGSTAVICVALCKPLDCYSGDCGASDENRLGEAPHRCNAVDRVGAFDTSPGGEHCQFFWRSEVDISTGTFLPSPFSDTLGVCFDHSRYAYDSNNDLQPDTVYPPCAMLQDGWGTGTNPADPLTYFGAANLGCVDSTRLPAPANGKRRVPDRVPLPEVRLLFGVR